MTADRPKKSSRAVEEKGDSREGKEAVKAPIDTHPVAEPAPLGLIGLAVAALVLASADLKYTSVASKSLMIPWTIFLGATAQLIAGIMDFKRKNIFGATAFTTYSMLWYSVSLTLYITIFTEAPFDIKHYAYGLIGFMIFSLILTLASLMTNKVFISILIFIDLAIMALVGHILWDWAMEPVGIALIGVSLFSFYGAMAALINTMAGKPVFPMGSAVWKP